MSKNRTLQAGKRSFNLEKLRAFDDHKTVKYVEEDDFGLRGFISIHRTNNKHPSFGATRVWNYSTERDALNDSLRLAKLMSYKSALAGLKCGGAKAVLIYSENSDVDKSKMLAMYAEKVNELEGRFVTGTDVGLVQKDVLPLQKISPYFAGLKLDPTTYTTFGLLLAVQTALHHVFDTRKLTKRTFAIQGVGKIGTDFLRLIYGDAKEIYVSDIDMRRLRALKSKYPKIKVVEPEEIHKSKVDVYVPCALSFAISNTTVEEIGAKIIAGGANNQLSSNEVGASLFKKKIIYVPDYVANAGGLISVVNEYYNKDIEPDHLMENISGIGERVRKILKESESKGIPTNRIADEMAEKIISKYEKAK